MTLGKRIKKLRQDKGLTQAQLGYMVNKHSAHMGA